MSTRQSLPNLSTTISKTVIVTLAAFLFAIALSGTIAPLAFAQNNSAQVDAVEQTSQATELQVAGPLGAASLSAADVASAPNVTKHTRADIIAYLAAHPASSDQEVVFAQNPVLNTTPGMLSQETKNSALTSLNNTRYIAGLNPVALNDSYGEMAQAGAFVDYAVDKLTHTPASDGLAKPSGMSDALWSLGNKGTSSSNLACGYGSLNSAVMYGWMSDADSSNIDRVGHRRWCLNPEMAATGFGYAGSYCAMYSFDSGASSAQSNVVWPAQAMPVELFSDTDPWSISVGTSISDPSAVKVTLVRASDGKTWTFSSLSASTPASRSDSYFGINNSYYGAPGCIIFRPNDVTYNAGDVFHVTATGVNGTTISYDVEFFSGYPVKSLSLGQETMCCTYDSEYLRPTVTPDNASSYQIAWKSSNTNVVTVDEYGNVRKVGVGEATVTATISGAYTATGNPLSASVKVVVPKPITTDYYNITIANLQYTGAAVIPQVTVVDKITGEKLVKGTDFEIELDNDITNAGDYTTVWIKGLGFHRASNWQGFPTQVQPRKITAGMASITTKTYVHNGKQQTQTVSVKYNGKALKQGANADYTVTYKNNVKAGTARVTVTGTGNFTGSVTKKFAIKKAANPMKVIAKKPAVKYSKKKARTIKAAKAYKFKKKAQGKVTYARVAKGSSKYLKVNKKTGAITVKKGAPKKVHRIKVKATAKGNTNYKAASKTITVKVRVR